MDHDFVQKIRRMLMCCSQGKHRGVGLLRQCVQNGIIVILDRGTDIGTRNVKVNPAQVARPAEMEEDRNQMSPRSLPSQQPDRLGIIR